MSGQNREQTQLTYAVAAVVEIGGQWVVQETVYDLEPMDERFDDGKNVQAFLGTSEAGHLALVNVVRVADGFEMWATAPTTRYTELLHHPSQFVSPGEASLMWPSRVYDDLPEAA